MEYVIVKKEHDKFSNGEAFYVQKKYFGKFSFSNMEDSNRWNTNTTTWDYNGIILFMKFLLVIGVASFSWFIFTSSSINFLFVSIGSFLWNFRIWKIFNSNFARKYHTIEEAREYIRDNMKYKIRQKEIEISNKKTRKSEREKERLRKEKLKLNPPKNYEVMEKYVFTEDTIELEKIK